MQERASRGNRARRPKEGECFDHTREFSGVIGMDFGSCVREMCFGRDNRTKHDKNPSLVRSCERIPSGNCFTVSKASTSVSVDGPSLEIIACVACCGTSWEDADILLWQLADEISDMGPQEYVSSSKLTGARGHRPE